MKTTLVKPLLALATMGSIVAGCSWWLGSAQSRGSSRPPVMGISKNTKVSPEILQRESEIDTLRKNARNAWREDRDSYKAEALLRQAVALNPDDTFAWRDLAFILDEAGRYKDALEAYRETTKARPRASSSTEDNPEILGRYAQMCEITGNDEEALSVYRRILDNYEPEEKPDFPLPDKNVKNANEVTSMARIVVALSYMTHGEDERAIPLFRKAIEADSKNAVAHLYLAWNLQGEPDGRAEAKEEYQRAMALAPSDKLLITRAQFGLDEMK